MEKWKFELFKESSPCLNSNNNFLNFENGLEPIFFFLQNIWFLRFIVYKISFDSERNWN